MPRYDDITLDQYCGTCNGSLIVIRDVFKWEQIDADGTMRPTWNTFVQHEDSEAEADHRVTVLKDTDGL